MKRIILVLVAVLLTGNAWADCRVYEYEEMKDMGKDELAEAKNKAFDEFVKLMGRQSGAVSSGSHDLARRYQKATDVCGSQMQKMSDVYKRRFPEAP